jgi:hypothetical protein
MKPQYGTSVPHHDCTIDILPTLARNESLGDLRCLDEGFGA